MTIKDLLIIAQERLDMKLSNLEETIKVIESEFKNVKFKTILEAFRFGTTGKYGVTYRLNTQVVCYWVRERLKENKVTI